MSTIRVQIALRAENLRNLAKFYCFKTGRSNPYAVVSHLANDEPLGRTEKISGELSPEWTQLIYFDKYEIGSCPFLLVKIFDERGEEPHEIIGEAQFNLRDVLEESKDAGTGVTEKMEAGGSLNMSAHESIQSTDRIKLHFRALDVKNIEGSAFALGLGRSDPFFTISKKYNCPEKGTVRWQRVYKSETIMDHLNPLWEPCYLNLEDICDNDLKRPISIILWDYESSGAHRKIGELETSLSFLKKKKCMKGNADRTNSLHFAKEDNKNKIVGLLIVLKVELLSNSITYWVEDGDSFEMSANSS